MTDPIGGPPPGAGGGGLRAKVLGLPTWGWIAIAAAAGIGGYIWLQSRKNNAAATSADSSGGDSTTATGSGQYASDVDQSLLAQIRDLQGQTSTPTDTTSTTQLPAPTGLKFTVLTPTAATLVWAPVTGAVSYRVTWVSPKGSYNNTPFVPMNTVKLANKKGDPIECQVVAVDESGTAGHPASIGATIK